MNYKPFTKKDREYLDKTREKASEVFLKHPDCRECGLPMFLIGEIGLQSLYQCPEDKTIEIKQKTA